MQLCIVIIRYERLNQYKAEEKEINTTNSIFDCNSAKDAKEELEYLSSPGRGRKRNASEYIVD